MEGRTVGSADVRGHVTQQEEGRGRVLSPSPRSWFRRPSRSPSARLKSAAASSKSAARRPASGPREARKQAANVKVYLANSCWDLQAAHADARFSRLAARAPPHAVLLCNRGIATPLPPAKKLLEGS